MYTTHQIKDVGLFFKTELFCLADCLTVYVLLMGKGETAKCIKLDYLIILIMTLNEIHCDWSKHFLHMSTIRKQALLLQILLIKWKHTKTAIRALFFPIQSQCCHNWVVCKAASEGQLINMKFSETDINTLGAHWAIFLSPYITSLFPCRPILI